MHVPRAIPCAQQPSRMLTRSAHTMARLPESRTKLSAAARAEGCREDRVSLQCRNQEQKMPQKDSRNKVNGTRRSSQTCQAQSPVIMPTQSPSSCLSSHLRLSLVSSNSLCRDTASGKVKIFFFSSSFQAKLHQHQLRRGILVCSLKATTAPGPTLMLRCWRCRASKQIRC